MLALLAAAAAATLAGVTLPDTATVGGEQVRLNGIGLREKYFIDIYVGALYLEHSTHDGAAAIAAEEAKRVVMHFVYRRISRDQIEESFRTDFGQRPGSKAHAASIQAIVAALPRQIVSGEELSFDYAPGVGTTFGVNGAPAVTIPGADFMRMVWGIWLGPTPPTEDVKRGMLGL